MLLKAMQSARAAKPFELPTGPEMPAEGCDEIRNDCHQDVLEGRHGGDRERRPDRFSAITDPCWFGLP